MAINMNKQVSVADATPEPSVQERRRVPFSTPTLRLNVPDIPGYHLHWFLSDQPRIERALQAGYEFVNRDEVRVNNRDSLGSDGASDGNADLGTRVSMVAGGDLGLDGQPKRLILMKLKEEWWRQDQAEATGPGSRLDGVRKAVLGGLIGQEQSSMEDKANVYVDTKKTRVPEFFKRK